VRCDVLVLPTGSLASVFAVRVTTVRHGHRHQVKVAVPHAAPGDESIGKLLDAAQRPAQHAGFQAMIMIEMNMQSGHRKIVMIVLRIGELPGQVTLVVIVDIGQDSDAIPFGIFVGPLSRQESPQQVAYGLGSAAVAQPLPITLESVGQFPVQGYGESLGHDVVSGKNLLHYARHHRHARVSPPFDTGQKSGARPERKLPTRMNTRPTRMDMTNESAIIASGRAFGKASSASSPAVSHLRPAMIPTILATTAKTMETAILTFVLILFSLTLNDVVAQSGPETVTADDASPVTLYVFKSNTCPHCNAQRAFTDALAQENPDVEVRYFEIMATREHHDLLRAMSNAHDIKPGSVPMVFLGGSVWVGDTPQIREEIEQRLEVCLETGCPDSRQLSFAPQAAAGQSQDAVDAAIDIPLLGTIDLSYQPLLLSTAIIAFVDGFNPCSLWLLTILIALVLHSGSRKRVLIVGSVFLFTTALIYGLFIVGVFSVLAYATYLPWMYWIVALFALTFGVVNIKDYFWFKRGFSFTIDDKYKPGIYQKFRGLMTNGRSPLALGAATAAMATGIALIELPCTAGFPVIWSGLVSAHAVGASAFFGLLVAYLLIYLLDELVIFFIAVAKLRIEKFQEGQARILKLIGGVVMIALAIVLVTEPDIMSQAGPAIGVFLLAFAIAGLIVLVHRKLLPRLGDTAGDDRAA